MAPKRILATTELQGRGPGTKFDGAADVEGIEQLTISRIVVHYHTCVNALTVHYTGHCKAVRYGGDSGTMAEVNLDPDEFINSIEARSSNASYLCQLTFTSNKGKHWGPYGTHDGHLHYNWMATTLVSPDLAPYMGLLYFSGWKGIGAIGKLQATFAKYPGPTIKHPSAVRYEKQSNDKNRPQSSTTISGFARSLMSPVITLTVGQEETEFHAYEDILCRLPFFRAALRTGFKETVDKKITMPEDEPEIIAALVEFLLVGTYTYTYDPGSESDTGEQTSPCDLQEGSFHLRLYAAAFKYDCEHLAGAALRSLVYVLQQLSDIEVIELLKETYERGCDTAVWGCDGMEEFKQKLPGIIKHVYVTHCDEMIDMVSGCSGLANDLLRLAVANV